MIKALLQSARDLIADPARWTRGAMARNRLGQSCSPHESEAVCYCSQGAISLKIYSTRFMRLNPVELIALKGNALIALDLAASHLAGKYMTIASFNDTHTHAEVLAVFDLAIERSAS